MKDKIEMMSGIQVQPIGLAEFSQYKGQIEELRFNVLGTSKHGIHEKMMPETRRDTLKPLNEELRGSAEHEAVYLAKNESGKVVGFLYIELHPDGHSAELKEMWCSMAENAQREVVEKLLTKVCTELPEDRYPKIDVAASDRSKHFNHFMANPRFKVLRVKEASADNDNESQTERDRNGPEQMEKKAA